MTPEEALQKLMEENRRLRRELERLRELLIKAGWPV
jgi:regulator of replication initiation timing